MISLGKNITSSRIRKYESEFFDEIFGIHYILYSNNMLTKKEILEEIRLFHVINGFPTETNIHINILVDD